MNEHLLQIALGRAAIFTAIWAEKIGVLGREGRKCLNSGYEYKWASHNFQQSCLTWWIRK